MKALFIYPEFPETFWSFKHALSLLGKKSAFPPLGLLTVSAMLPKTWERRLVDMNVRPLRDSDIEWADMVFASAMQVQKNSLRHVIDLCNARGKKIVVGGPYAAICPDELTGADHIFIGEAENTVPVFIEELERGEAKPIYRTDERPSLNCSPIPDFHLAELDLYSDMSVQYSRGCPFQCEFCDIIEIYGRIPRTKSNEQLLAELDALRAAGWNKDVFIVDDNFIGNKRNVKSLLPKLAEWSERLGHPFCFITEASVNVADDDALLDLMRQANFTRIFIGIETPVEASLKEAQKGQNTRRDLTESVRKVQSYGMEVMGGFIVGFDNDPEDIFQRQIDFIRESAIPLAMVGLLAAVPTTQLWRRLEREGRLITLDWQGNNTDCALNFIPKMDSAQLIEGYKRILRTIYSPSEYYDRALVCLERIIRDSAPKPRADAVSLNDIISLGRLVLRLGVRDSARIEFWRYMRRVITRHREKFEHAVVLAAMGYHLRKLTETNCG
jgi:radical SAM superfamily enzyme YgiQ (UPF0313 family)